MLWGVRNMPSLYRVVASSRELSEGMSMERGSSTLTAWEVLSCSGLRLPSVKLHVASQLGQAWPE